MSEPLDRSDDAVLGRLIERSRLLIALADDIPVEAKLQSQPLLKQLEQLLAAAPDDRDTDRIHQTHRQLCAELEEFADLDALLQAMINFLPPR